MSSLGRYKDKIDSLLSSSYQESEDLHEAVDMFLDEEEKDSFPMEMVDVDSYISELKRKGVITQVEELELYSHCYSRTKSIGFLLIISRLQLQREDFDSAIKNLEYICKQNLESIRNYDLEKLYPALRQAIRMVLDKNMMKSVKLMNCYIILRKAGVDWNKFNDTYSSTELKLIAAYNKEVYEKYRITIAEQEVFTDKPAKADSVQEYHTLLKKQSVKLATTLEDNIVINTRGKQLLMFDTTNKCVKWSINLDFPGFFLATYKKSIILITTWRHNEICKSRINVVSEKGDILKEFSREYSTVKSKIVGDYLLIFGYTQHYEAVVESFNLNTLQSHETKLPNMDTLDRYVFFENMTIITDIQLRKFYILDIHMNIINKQAVNNEDSKPWGFADCIPINDSYLLVMNTAFILLSSKGEVMKSFMIKNNSLQETTVIMPIGNELCSNLIIDIKPPRETPLLNLTVSVNLEEEHAGEDDLVICYIAYSNNRILFGLETIPLSESQEKYYDGVCDQHMNSVIIKESTAHCEKKLVENVTCELYTKTVELRNNMSRYDNMIIVASPSRRFVLNLPDTLLNLNSIKLFPDEKLAFIYYRDMTNRKMYLEVYDYVKDKLVLKVPDCSPSFQALFLNNYIYLIVDEAIYRFNRVK